MVRKYLTYPCWVLTVSDQTSTKAVGHYIMFCECEQEKGISVRCVYVQDFCFETVQCVCVVGCVAVSSLCLVCIDCGLSLILYLRMYVVHVLCVCVSLICVVLLL